MYFPPDFPKIPNDARDMDSPLIPSLVAFAICSTCVSCAVFLSISQFLFYVSLKIMRSSVPKVQCTFPCMIYYYLLMKINKIIEKDIKDSWYSFEVKKVFIRRLYTFLT